MGQFLNATPLWVLALLLFACLMAAWEAGAWLERRLSAAQKDGDDSELGYMHTGVLGLLALLIAFTFGLALERYQTRRDLVVAEANAIGTAEMRVHLLDPPYAGRLAGLFRTYAETRLRYGEAPSTQTAPLERQSDALRGRIQAETLAAVWDIRTTPLAALVVSAVNEALDTGAEREAAHAARLPTTVVVALVVYALVSAAVLGHALARARRPYRATSALLFLLLTLALTLILDLDRPRRGTITISQEPMARLIRSLSAAMPASPSSPAAQAPGTPGGSAPP